jgi:hypothetical protein
LFGLSRQRVVTEIGVREIAERSMWYDEGTGRKLLAGPVVSWIPRIGANR